MTLYPLPQGSGFTVIFDNRVSGWNIRYIAMGENASNQQGDGRC